MTEPVLVQPVEWLGDRVRLLDQTRLPVEEFYQEITDYRDIAGAIKELMVRGAPAIGVAGAYGVALGALSISTSSLQAFRKQLSEITRVIGATRPTARNLFWAIERMEKASKRGRTIEEIKQLLVDEARLIHAGESEASLKISQAGAALLKDGFTVLTHCNAGPLAATGYGTALGVIIYAHHHGKRINVFADETRPLLQGSRITTWECQKAGVPVTLITDSMAGHFMKQGKIDCVIVGADRIAANGDTANKIGTYSVAVLAKENGVPFYVAAPMSTVDFTLSNGGQIVIEERPSEEIRQIKGIAIAPKGVAVANPAFDVTPVKYVTAFITDKGIVRRPE